MNFFSDMKHYINWFKKLYKEYGLFSAILYAKHNAKHYNLDGEYK